MFLLLLLLLLALLLMLLPHESVPTNSRHMALCRVS